MLLDTNDEHWYPALDAFPTTTMLDDSEPVTAPPVVDMPGSSDTEDPPTAPTWVATGAARAVPGTTARGRRDPDTDTAVNPVAARTFRQFVPRRGAGLFATVGGAAAVTLLVAGLVAVGTDPAPTQVPPITAKPPSPTSAAAPSTTVEAGAWCADMAAGTPVDTLGPPTTPEGLVATFEDAYYTRRDAVAARALVAPDGAVGSEDAMQAAIDALTPGTTWCALVRPTTADTVEVDLYARAPTGAVEHHPQVITYRRADDGTGLQLLRIAERKDDK